MAANGRPALEGVMTRGNAMTADARAAAHAL